MSKIRKMGRDACSRSAALSRISDPLIRFVETSRGAVFQARPGRLPVRGGVVRQPPKRPAQGPRRTGLCVCRSRGHRQRRSEITDFWALALRQDRPYDAALRVVRAPHHYTRTDRRQPHGDPPLRGLCPGGARSTIRRRGTAARGAEGRTPAMRILTGLTTLPV
jgi:hypothetical protein